MVFRVVLSVGLGLIVFFASLSARSDFGEEQGRVDNVSAESTVGENTAALPLGFEHRLRPKGQSLREWHAWNESKTALTLGGMYLGGWAAHKIVSRYTSFSFPVLLTGAGIAMDYMSSADMSDFSWRVGMRTPLFLAGIAANRSPFYIPEVVTESLLVEAPIAIKGIGEYLQQSESTISGINTLIPGSKFDRTHLRASFAIEPQARLELQFKNKLPPDQNLICESDAATVIADYPDVHSELLSLSCAARNTGIQKIELTPQNNKIKTLDITFKLLSGQLSLLSLQFPDVSSQLPWLTESLSKNSIEPGIEQVLSPLSRCVVAEIADLITSSQVSNRAGLRKAETIISSCTDLKTTTLSTDNLLLLPLGGKGYLLADHGLSQGAGHPLIWMNSEISSELLTQEWLDGLQSQLIPGSEKGVWRGVSILRSVIYRAAANYGLNWLLQRSAQQQPSAPASTTPAPALAQNPVSGIDVSDSPMTMGAAAINGLSDAGQAQLKTTIENFPTDKKVVVILGESRTDNSSVAHQLLGCPECSDTFAAKYEDNLIRVYDQPGSDTIYVELHRDLYSGGDDSWADNITSPQGIENIKTALARWLNQAHCFIALLNSGNAIQAITLRNRIERFRDAGTPLPNVVALRDDTLFFDRRAGLLSDGEHRYLFRAGDTLENLVNDPDVQQLLNAP